MSSQLEVGKKYRNRTGNVVKRFFTEGDCVCFGLDDIPESENPVVVIESPYSGENQDEVDKNVAYAKEALKDSLLRGESPMASHLLYTQTLNDNDEMERNTGMEAGWQFYRHAAKCVVYADRGITMGMAEGMQIALEHGVPVEVRKLYD